MKKATISLLLFFGFQAIWAQEPLFLGDNYYHKRMVKVFEALKEHRPDKAASYWQDIEHKAAKDKTIDGSRPVKMLLYPVWQLSECMMMNQRDGRGKQGDQLLLYNPWSAYALLHTIYASGTDLRNANLFLTHKDIELQVADIKKSIEDNLLDSVRRASTEEGYDRLLGMLFDSREALTNLLRKEREQVAFDALCQTNSLKESQRYLDKYAQEATPWHKSIMTRRRDSLAFCGMATTAAACADYLRRYPESYLRDSVTWLLHERAFCEMPHTEQACNDYLAAYPASHRRLEVEGCRVDYAFDEARKADTMEGYERFLGNYRNSKYQDEAVGLLQQTARRKFWRADVDMAELARYRQGGAYRVESVCQLYDNLLLLPTSSMMMGYGTVSGRIVTVTAIGGTEHTEEMVFDRHHLLVSRYDSRTGKLTEYRYGFDNEHGFQLVSRIDGNTGGEVRYQLRYNNEGRLCEVGCTDGRRMVYTLTTAGAPATIANYERGRIAKTDTYEHTTARWMVIGSARPGGVSIAYTYNDHGDVATMSKMHGGVVMEQTRYEYDYGSSEGWTHMNQYNGTTLLLTKSRQYDR